MKPEKKHQLNCQKCMWMNIYIGHPINKKIFSENLRKNKWFQFLFMYLIPLLHKSKKDLVGHLCISLGAKLGL